MLSASGLTLVSSAEVAGSDVTPAFAAAFVGAPEAEPQAAQGERPGAAAVVEEELDDMA